MAANHISSGTATFSGASGTASITIASGQSLGILYIAREAGDTAVSGTTWNGGSVSAQEATAYTVSDGIARYGAVYTGLSAGTFNFVLTVNATPTVGHLIWMVFDNPNTSDSIGDADQLANTSSPTTLTSTTDTNALILVGIYSRQPLVVMSAVTAFAIQSGNGQTQISAPADNANGNSWASSYRQGDTSAQTGYVFTDSAFPQVAMIAMAVNGVTGGGGSPVHRMTLLGVG